MHNFCLLVKVRLDERFDISRLRYTKDFGAKIGIIAYKLIRLILFAALFLIFTFAFREIAQAGLVKIIPITAYFLASVTSFLITTVNMNEVLTGNEDSEFLLSTHISEFAYVAIMFLTLYIRSLIYVLLISGPAAIIYSTYFPSDTDFIPYWILGVVFTSLPTGGIAALFGMAITLTLAESPKKNQIQSSISIMFLVLGTVLILFLASHIGPALSDASANSDAVAEEIITLLTRNFRFPRFYQFAIVENLPGYLIAFCLVSAVWYVGFSLFVGISYRIMIISVRCPVLYKGYTWTEQKAVPMKKAVFQRELQQFIRSKSYFTKSMTGIIVGSILAISSCITGNTLLLHYLRPEQLPFLICCFVGLSNTTYCALSIEGRNHWITESSPMDEKIIFSGKVKVNLLFTIPFSILSGVCFAILAKPHGLWVICYILIPTIYAVLNAYWGIRIDKKYGDDSKESEQQAMHQGLSYVLGYLPGVIVPILILAALWRI